MSDSEERKVLCAKLGRELPGLKKPPYRNDLGKRIFEQVSAEAWEMWKKDSVKFINTYRVDLASAEGARFMFKQCEIYFGFSEEDAAATAWTPPKESE